MERRRRALAVIGTSPLSLPTNHGNGAETARPRIELFTCGSFIGLAAPDAATAAPVLEKLRAEDLFRVAQPPPPPPPPPTVVCSRCRAARPVNSNGLCDACAPSTTKITKSPHRSRAWMVILLLSALIALALYIWWPKPSPEQATAPVVAPIVQFSANHQSVKRGTRVLLSWSTSGFSTISISPNIGPVPASGKRWVVINRDTTFSLIGTGTSYMRPVTVTITVVDSATDQPSKPSDYPDSSTSNTPPPASQITTPPVAEVQSPKLDPSYENRPAVNAALNDWAASYRANDASRQAALYAPQVERFFKQQNVTNAYVLTYMTNFYARGSHFTSFSFTSPAITFVDENNAHVNFIKTYTLQLASGETRNVTSRSELHLVRTSGNVWKINFERDFLG